MLALGVKILELNPKYDFKKEFYDHLCFLTGGREPAAGMTGMDARLRPQIRDPNRLAPTFRGGRLTSLDASFMRCFGFFGPLWSELEEAKLLFLFLFLLAPLGPTAKTVQIFTSDASQTHTIYRFRKLTTRTIQ